MARYTYGRTRKVKKGEKPGSLAQDIRDRAARDQVHLGAAYGPGASSIKKTDRFAGPRPVDTRGYTPRSRSKNPKAKMARVMDPGDGPISRRGRAFKERQQVLMDQDRFGQAYGNPRFGEKYGSSRSSGGTWRSPNAARAQPGDRHANAFRRRRYV
jgi:hypothetical protein